MTHCNATHEGLSYVAAKDEDGNLHVAVQSQPNFAVTSTESHLQNYYYYKGNTTIDGRQNLSPIPSIQRPYCINASLDISTRKKKIKLLEINGNDKKAIMRYLPTGDVPIRQYYHSRTNLPMGKGEWDYDSDEEPDDSWLHQISEELIDEFEDVSKSEKIFFKKWNRFMKSHVIVPDRCLPRKCLEFVKIHGLFLAKNSLRQNLLKHLLNLWDHSLLSSHHILTIMTTFDTIRQAASPPTLPQSYPTTNDEPQGDCEMSSVRTTLSQKRSRSLYESSFERKRPSLHEVDSQRLHCESMPAKDGDADSMTEPAVEEQIV